MKKLDTKELIASANAFCKQESGKYRAELFGATDGKKVGTIVEHLFQKIYGLGYNLIVFVYQKVDDVKNKTGMLEFLSCTYIDKSRTADYQTTTGLRRIIENNGNVDDVFAFLSDHKIPADDVTLYGMAESILKNPPEIGYLTVSNALQWRLQYGRIVALDEQVEGIFPIIKYEGDK